MTALNARTTPKISVLLPVHNGAPYLEQCISSVLDQSCTGLELLIGDDCSRDSSPQIIDSFHDERIRVFKRQTNLGLFANLNDLIGHSNAPIIRLLGQDDVLLQDCLHTEVAFFEEHPDIGMTFCKAVLVDENTDTIGRSPINDMPSIVPPALSMQLYFYYGCLPGNISTVCLRRDALDRIGLFNSAIGAPADYDLWVRMCLEYDMGVIHKYLIKLRSHTHQLSRKTKSVVETMKTTYHIRKKLLNNLPSSVRTSGRRYLRSKVQVPYINFAIGRLLSGDSDSFLKVVRTYGLQEFMYVFGYWLITLNNRLYKPKPKFITNWDLKA